MSDPNHQVDGGRVEYNKGACDGWLLAPGNDLFSIGYYDEADLQFFGPAARNWTVCDRYFCGIMGPTIPNRIFQHTAQTDRLDDVATLTSLRTIWDRLLLKGLSGRYYLSGIGGKLGFYNVLSLWGLKYLGIGSTLPVFLEACASGKLANVSFVDPNFNQNSDHPHQDIRDGEAFLNTVYNAVTTSPAWPRTVLVITFDEWGGFFDHVAPTEAPISDITRNAGAPDGLRGFRVPTLLISPFARRGFVSSELFDHASVLRMIEWRWDLEPLTERDATANNLADALDFSHRDLTAPQFLVPPGPNGSPCE
jgi:phospholipase C